ncbi:NAD(P)-dependent oxidoreductase [uncultured Deinococcus sp.]|uniref:NAD(P)-dependent oxidoreductase n=1 Tax=uncultured Deinococcus sp. TaxID=158789 RepID=UPI0025D79A07|nr:NAD(P)H-binding protein [uncultured Deinococcus sp.]
MGKIVIFGATGGTGRQLVQQALNAGHAVTVLVRQEGILPGVRQVVGDVRNHERVGESIHGQDVVLCALGPSQKNAPVCADAARSILAGMQAGRVTRLVALSAYGVAETRRGLYSAVTWALLRDKMQDKEQMEALIRASGVDWTLIRPPALRDGVLTGAYRTGTDLPVSLVSAVTRADVAHFMLREAVARAYLHAAPTIVATRAAAGTR